MSRVRTNNVFGTLTDNPLTAGAVTMNSAGLANLAAVSGSEAIITLDPNRVDGAPEIVVVTAHTASATSATIQRGQFGTTAREHAQGTEWEHAPITTNATTFVTQSSDQGDFVPMGAWESYTPTNSNVTVGNGTEVASFVRIGRTIHWSYTLTFGSTTAFTGSVIIGLPVGAATTTLGSLASGWAFDTSATANTRVLNGLKGAGATQCQPHADGATVCNATTPFTWATGDVLSLFGTYEAAS